MIFLYETCRANQLRHSQMILSAPIAEWSGARLQTRSSRCANKGDMEVEVIRMLFRI